MAIALVNDHSGSDLSAFSSPLRSKFSGSGTATDSPKTSTAQARPQAVTEIINPARESIAAMMTQSGMEKAPPAASASIEAALRAFSAF